MTAVAIDLAQIAAHLAAQQNTINGTVEIAANWVIPDEATYQATSQLLIQVKTKFKELEDSRKSYTKPLRDLTAKINRDFKPITDDLQKVEAGLKRAMVDFQQRKALEARKALEESQKALDEGNHAEFREQLQKANTPVHAEGVSTRQVWRFEVVNPDAVPRAFLKVDEQKIGATVRALKGEVDIPGVRVWAEDSLTVRTGG